MQKPIRALLITFFVYLLQVCVVPYLKIAEITPNLMLVNIAIFTVSYGKKYAFGTAAMTGILLETMSVNVNVLIMVIYPLYGLLCAQVFADMSDRKREQRRIGNKSQNDKNVYLRILANTLILTVLYESTMLLFTSLTGITVTIVHLIRTVRCLLYTEFIALLVMIPIRWALGMYKRRAHIMQTKEGAIL
jgi:hypothetical protein